jgi:hypothetical protein
MPTETKEQRESRFKRELANHTLEDLERILVVNDRKNIAPDFYSLVTAKIRLKKCNPIVFIRYYWQSFIPIVISLVALWRTF